MTNLKVKCIKKPDDTNMVRDITIGLIYKVKWSDDNDFKLVCDDNGNERFYQKECFKIITKNDI